jgi:hypothetical protein
MRSIKPFDLKESSLKKLPLLNLLNCKSSVSRLVNNLFLLSDDIIKNPWTIYLDINTTPVMKKTYYYAAITGRIK